MSKFENLRFYIGSGEDRAENLRKVEAHLQALGYKPLLLRHNFTKWDNWIITDEGEYFGWDQKPSDDYKDCPIPEATPNLSRMRSEEEIRERIKEIEESIKGRHWDFNERREIKTLKWVLGE